MKSLTQILLLNLAICKALLGQDVAVVTGQFENLKFENISLQCDENPYTGAREEFKAVELDSGKFEIFVKMYSSGTYNLVINNNFVDQIFLCPGQSLMIALDSNGFQYKGVTQDFKEWNQTLYTILNQYSIENSEYDSTENISKLVNHLFKQKKENEILIKEIASDFNLDACEYNYCKYRNQYAIYTLIWSDLYQRGYTIDSDVFNFLKDLPLDDFNAVNTSLDYNRAISVYIFLKLRLDNGWYKSNSFDSRSDEFNNLYYNKILTEITNEEVRNVTLTRKLTSLLSSGSTSADALVKKYFTDCTNSSYKETVYEYYNEYLTQKNSSLEKPDIKRLSGALNDELNKYKGQVVYLDFWASWCSPCRAGIPFTKELQNKYNDQAFQVVYVNVDDNYGEFETTAKKLGLSENLIYLDKEQSTEIGKQLSINGIPHYVLLDKNGDIVAMDAPEPNSLAIEKILDELLSE